MSEPTLEQARALRAGGKPAEALRILAQLPESLESRLELADCQHSVGLTDDAAATLARLASLNPDEPRVHRLLGRVQLSAGRYTDADSAYARALALDPSDAPSTAGRADAMHRAGDAAGALALLEARLTDDPPSEAIASVFARLARRAGRLDEALGLLDRALSREDLSTEGRAGALHARGQTLDALARYDDAFADFAASNTLRTTAFDADAQERLFARIRGVYPPGSPRALPNSGLATNAPLFIVGMPRSGTTLTEQILASHPAVRAGGERPDIRSIIMSFPRRTAPPAPFPDGARTIPGATLRQLANAYAAPLLGPGVERITDKTPMNFMAIGLIAQLFPGARIIHCVRHPLDTCFSCFVSNFAGAHPYTRDLVALGRFYAQYERMMAHWKSASPLPIFDMDYEALVADQEGRSRALLEFAGLAWNDACLRFHETDRPVHTASFDQVRRPMYDASVGRWKHYRNHLGPLIETLAGEGVEPRAD